MNSAFYSISVVIPNYNGRHLLESNLPAVYNALHTSGIDDFEIIITDDASQDDSVAFIEDNYSDIILLKNTRNLGFAGNINKGIRQASKSLVLLLNSDIVLSANYFKAQLAYFDKPDTFGVMGKIFSSDSQHPQVEAKYPGYSYTSIKPGKNYFCQHCEQVYTYYLSGANALIDRQKLLLLGGFNESFSPYYYEDVDLGLRAWRLGFKLYFEEKAVCRHLKSATISQEPSDKVKVIYKRNKFCLHYLHFEATELRVYLIKLFVKSFLRMLIRDKKYIASYRQFRHLRPQLITEKLAYKQLQDRMQVHYSLSDIARYIKKQYLQSSRNKTYEMI